MSDGGPDDVLNLAPQEAFEQMKSQEAEAYWSSLCEIVSGLRPCWVRVAWRHGASREESPWGQQLAIPTPGYLEGPAGPIPFRDVEWVEVSMSRVRGGMPGKPLEIVDAKEEMLAALGETSLDFELRDVTWSLARLFDDRPLEAAHCVNPLFRSNVS